ncbi:MAG: HAD family hydrolase [Nitrospiraceae bacterium]|nr:HAD family hydrolase [Nitrospiraceae bacterium]
MAKKLVLFDIDGTLLDSGRAGTRALDHAFAEVFSIEDAFEGIRMSGKTDIEIIKEAMRKHSLSVDGKIPVIMEAYIRHLRREIDNPEKHLKPGIREAVNILNIMSRVELGLLTGNIEEGARIKLGAFGLNEYFQIGAFGSDEEDRNRLLPIAAERFRSRYGEDISYKDVVVIGDTPRDVECAKPYGAFTMAVATGPYTAAQLLASGADSVLEDLSDTRFFIARLNL